MCMGETTKVETEPRCTSMQVLSKCAILLIERNLKTSCDRNVFSEKILILLISNILVTINFGW